MSNEAQEKTLKEVLDLELYLISAEEQLFEIKSETFREPPKPPVCKTVTRTYPEIKSTVQFNKALAIIPSLICWPWFIIYYFAMYKPKQKEDIERIRNSKEYKAECARLDSTYDAKQQEFDQKYDAEKEKYDTEILPKYNDERNAWNVRHEKEMGEITNDIINAKKKLESIYATTRIVPAQYRNVEALQYIYDLVSTSDYDVTYAISNYDLQRQRSLEEARIQEQQVANSLANEQARLLAEQNQIAEKARRDAAISNAIGMVQQHNRNKTLKDISKKF